MESRKLYNSALLIGVGTKGCSALQYIHSEEISKTFDFVATDTDIHALNKLNLPLDQKLLIGEKTTQGLATNGNPEQGRLAAIESTSLIKQYLSANYKLVYILAGMGGGTGTGASPVIAQLCKELEILTIGVFSLPFLLEGDLKQKQAIQGLKKVKGHVDTVFHFSNDDILNQYSIFKLPEPTVYSDAVFMLPIKSITNIISTSGYINLDFRDIKSILSRSGFSAVTFGIAKGDNRVKLALGQILKSPYIFNACFEEVQHILIQMETGSKELDVEEVFEIEDYFKRNINKNITIYCGIANYEELDDNLRINAVIARIKKKADSRIFHSNLN